MRGSARTAIDEIERLADEAKKEPESLMVNSVLEVDENRQCERFDHPPSTGEPSAVDQKTT